ncbi:SPOSA6832_01753 [Sporobolomyces salmonicolor]|uniref:Nickel/cobalt efflux system n=1 Tax=Sporidiobolus salmonicolor TaxID=5005 RepID=A0A0D6EKN3_SPOSA|nr:SPOSA6832_01753 [Sporobolomyces salmonicolor]
MDHIVAIDNVTRNLVSMGKLPVTVGLFFSLGHSTIVISMTIAIIIATSAIDKLPDISSVGGVIAVINSVVLWQSLRLAKRRRQLKEAMRAEQADIVPVAESTPDPTMSKKLDDEEADQPQTEELVPGLQATTSLLGISALARSGSSRIPTAQIILLPLLFTAGMTAVDSLDSMFMLGAYTFPSRAHQLEEKEGGREGEGVTWWKRLRVFERGEERVEEAKAEERARQLPAPDQNKLLSMSVVLTVISIVVALLISIPTTTRDSPVDGGASAGYLGAGVVSIFVLVFSGWGVQHYWRRRQERRRRRAEGHVEMEEKA